MAKKKPTVKKNNVKKKKSWFRLPVKGEISSFITGVAVVCLIGVVIWAIVTSYFLGPSEEEQAELALRVQESRLHVENHQASGLISKMDPKEEVVLVNAGMWAEMDRIKQEKLLSSIIDVIESDRCFVKDLATSKTLAWYSRRGGFREAKDVGGEE